MSRVMSRVLGRVMSRVPSQARDRQRGYTLVEMLVVLAIMSVIATMGWASLLPVLKRQKLVGTTREASLAMRQARAEAVKRGLRAGVAQDFAGNRLVVFRDANADGTYTTSDPMIAFYPLPPGVYMRGPGDTESTPANASWGFGEIAGSTDPGVVLFNSVGAATATGAFRFTDGSGNYFEARVDPAASGRVTVRKYLAAEADVNDVRNWSEQGSKGVKWVWN